MSRANRFGSMFGEMEGGAAPVSAFFGSGDFVAIPGSLGCGSSINWKELVGIGLGGTAIHRGGESQTGERQTWWWPERAGMTGSSNRVVRKSL